jgi:hypothetical protein
MAEGCVPATAGCQINEPGPRPHNRFPSLTPGPQDKGTGYSSYSHKGWDIKAYQAAQTEKDKQIQLVLEKICSELKRLHSITTVQAR